MPKVEEVFKTNIPARLDRLPWCRWHWLIVLSLGTVWILDGLEVTIKGAVGASLRDSIGFSTVQVAGSASIYILGAISGALFWGYLTDRFGRKKLFIITLSVYLLGVATTATAGLWVSGGTATYVWFAIGRVVTGFGIGGEYSAINSAIDELIPARVRGTVDLVVNGSYWLGAGIAALLGYLYLSHLPSALGWRLAFGTGAVVAVGVLLLRFFVPESPRWLIIHGKRDEAERVVCGIEERVEHDTGEPLTDPEDKELELRSRRSTGFVEIAKTVSGVYPRRSVVGFSLMASQAFLYNALFFTYGLMHATFYGVQASDVGLFLLPFAVGNLIGPILLGPLFDRIGRRPMIGSTFILGGLLTVLTGWLFQADALNVWWQTGLWVAIFFFASAGASAGYLTVSKTFPLEIRAMVIAFFYAIGTGVSGIVGPWLFGNLISSQSRTNVFWGYAAAGVVMVAAGIIHATMGVRAEQASLEEVAAPLSSTESNQDESAGDRRAPDQDDTDRRDVAAQDGSRGRHRKPEHAPTPINAHAPAGTFPIVHEDGDNQAVLGHETGVLIAALSADGSAGRRELSRRVGAKYGGPGRFRQAVRYGVRTHRIIEDHGQLSTAFSPGGRSNVNTPNPTGAGGSAARDTR